MPRFFFHVYNSDISLDEEGQELPDLAAARTIAIDAARDLACEAIHRGRLNLEDHIEVADESGATVLSLTFREAFTLEGD